MTETYETAMIIASWDEKPYREFPDGRRFSRADVVLGGDGEPLSGAFEAVLYYRPDGTSDYAALMQLDGDLDGHSGSFVLRGHGTFDGSTARVELAVVPGSGTGDLTGIAGTATSVSTHADYPRMPLVLRYDLA